MVFLAALWGTDPLPPLQVAVAAGEDAAGTPARREVDAGALAADDTLYLGKKITYWLKQAAAKNPAEPKPRIVAALSRALESKVAAVRVTAVDALGSLGPDAQPAAAALVRRLDDQMWVATAAADVLSGLGRAAVPHLIDAFDKGPVDARPLICRVLGAIGPDAAAATATLEKAARSAPPGLRDRINLALAQIQAKPVMPAVHAGDQPVASPAAGSRLLRPTPGAAQGAREWPQFRGPRRDAVCTETGLSQDWSASEPKLLWHISGLGKGYSSVAVAGGRLFTMGDRPGAGKTEAQLVLTFDLATRRELWATPIGPAQGDGPRCTPTLDGDRLYAIGTDGDLVCLETASGRVLWRKHFVHDFGGQMMSHWRFSESPLVDGDRLVCTPGGKEATMIALEKRTGKLIWKCAVPSLGPCGNDGASYASALVAEIAGVRQYVQLLGRGLAGVEAQTGRFLWGYNAIANTTCNAATPVVRGDYVFGSTAYNTGSALVKVVRDGDSFRAEESYFLKPDKFQNHHGGMVLVGDYLFGGHGLNHGDPVCIEFATGRICWKAKAPAPGSAAVLYADGHLLFRYDRGTIILVEANPAVFRAKGRLAPLTADGPAWAYPVVHQGQLYLRHGDLLACYDLRPSP
jgi:outer membrane protein assembly factor BamB